MVKKISGVKGEKGDAKALLPEDKVKNIVEILDSGDPDKLKEINRFILQYKFSDDRITEILRNTPIDKLLKVNVENLNPKIVVRVIACCVKNIRESADKKFIYKSRRILEIAYDNLYKIGFGTEEFKELAEIDDSKVAEYVEEVSNDYDIQDKVFLPKDRIADVIHLMESGTPGNLKKINEMIVRYKFSDERLADIIKGASMESLLKIDVSLLSPKIVVRVIACCVKVLKQNPEISMKNKFRQVLDFAVDKLYSINLGRDEYLELARIENERVLNFAVLSNNFEVRDLVARTATDIGIVIEAG